MDGGVQVIAPNGRGLEKGELPHKLKYEKNKQKFKLLSDGKKCRKCPKRFCQMD